MGTLNLKAVKDLPRTHYSKGDNSGRKPFLRTVTTRGGNGGAFLSSDTRFLPPKLVRIAVFCLAYPLAVYLYFRTLMNGCMTPEIRGAPVRS